MHYKTVEKKFYLASTIASHGILAHYILNSIVLGPANYTDVYQMSLAVSMYVCGPSLKHRGTGTQCNDWLNLGLELHPAHSRGMTLRLKQCTKVRKK